MLALRELQALARQMRRSGLAELEVSGADYRVRMQYAPQPAVAPQAVTETAAVALPEEIPPLQVTAPAPGRVWLQEPLSGKNVGAIQGAVQAGELLALLQSGPMCLPVRIPQNGALSTVLVAQGERVEYGQPLAEIVAEGE